MNEIIANIVCLIFFVCFPIIAIIVFIRDLTRQSKYYKIYDAKQLRKDKNDDRYIRHFIVWLQDLLKKQKFKYQEISIKSKNKEYPFQLRINNYKGNWKIRDKNDFRRYLNHIKEGILLGQIIGKKNVK